MFSDKEYLSAYTASRIASDFLMLLGDIPDFFRQAFLSLFFRYRLQGLSVPTITPTHLYIY
jgi:hypothetical protein